MADKSIFNDPNFKINTCPFIHDVKGKPDLQIKPFGTTEGTEMVEIYAMVCMECGAVGPYSYTPEDAAINWNRREFVILSQEQYDKYMEEDNASGQEEGKEGVGESQKESGKDNKKDAKKLKKTKAKT